MHPLVKLYRRAKKAKGHDFATKCVQRFYRHRYAAKPPKVDKYAWREEDHPRGQPENAGEFAEVHATIGDSAGEGVHLKLRHGSHIVGPEQQQRETEEATSDLRPLDSSGGADLMPGKPQPTGDVLPTPETPQRTPEERTSIESDLKESTPKLIEPLQKGRNVSLIVTMENGRKGVFKPIFGEHRGLRRDISGDYASREVAAYEVAKIVGMDDLVPVTIKRMMPSHPARKGRGPVKEGEPGYSAKWGKLNEQTIPDTPAGPESDGSCQEFCEGAKNAADVPDRIAFDGEKDATRAAVFDFIMGNTDRHGANWMVDASGKLRLIDNGLSLPESHHRKTVDMIGELRNQLGSYWKAAPLDEAKTAWQGKFPEIAEALKAQGINEKAISLAEKRYEIVMSAPTFGKATEALYGIADQ